MPKWDEEDHERHKDCRENEVAKEAEVKAALEKAEKIWSEGGTIPFHTLDGHFRLYSITHLDLVYDPIYFPSKYVEFYYYDEEDQADYSGLRARDGKRLLNGHLHFNGSVDCSFQRFLPPLEVSSKDFEVKSHEGNGKYTVAFQVIDNDHLIMKASRKLVFMDQPKKTRGPETFVFMGIRDGSGRERLLKILEGATVRPRTGMATRGGSQRSFFITALKLGLWLRHAVGLDRCVDGVGQSSSADRKYS